MKVYKYTLDKKSKKYICPKCNKKTLVKYIETATNNYLGDEFGRCDRETNCNFHNTPISLEKNTFEITNVVKPLPSFHSLELVEKSLLGKNKNNFIDFLKTIFTAGEVEKTVATYFIGSSKHWNGATIFWQIDNFERVHAGKILQYNPQTCKRAKDTNGKSLINWVHSVLKYTKTINEFNLHQCLFGLHLIVDNNIKTIGLVESEKTAVIMHLFKPNYIWLATGSKHGFKLEYLLPIKKYKIVAFPDKSEFNDWNKKAKELNKLGFQIDVNDYLETINCNTGVDFADILINQKK